MKWFEKKKPTGKPPQVQLRDWEHHPFGILDQYVPLRSGEIALYRSIREAVPILDAAIWKLVRLCGGVQIRCGDPRAQQGLSRFLATVDTGRGQQGIQSFLDQYLDCMITCGQGVGEMVLDPQGKSIAAVLCAAPALVEIREGDSPLDFRLCVRENGGEPKELPWQQLLLFTPFQPEAEHPYGVSMLRGIPFMADVLMKIYHTIGVNWERCGNVRFAVPSRDSEGSAAQRGQALAQEWSRAMQETRSGDVRDLVAVGDVDIRVIGADAPVLDSQVPVRQVMEQIVAKTGIPPFMLGLNWNSTERMSAQQADMLTTEITALRRTLTPVVEKICRMWLRMQGSTETVTVDWEDINLQDEVEEAKAELYREQARKLRNENDLAEKK